MFTSKVSVWYVVQEERLKFIRTSRHCWEVHQKRYPTSLEKWVHFHLQNFHLLENEYCIASVFHCSLMSLAHALSQCHLCSLFSGYLLISLYDVHSPDDCNRIPVRQGTSFERRNAKSQTAYMPQQQLHGIHPGASPVTHSGISGGSQQPKSRPGTSAAPGPRTNLSRVPTQVQPKDPKADHLQQPRQQQVVPVQHHQRVPIPQMPMNDVGKLGQQMQSLNVAPEAKGLALRKQSSNEMPELDPSVVRRSHSFTSASLQQRAQMQGNYLTLNLYCWCWCFCDFHAYHFIWNLFCFCCRVLWF